MLSYEITKYDYSNILMKNLIYMPKGAGCKDAKFQTNLDCKLRKTLVSCCYEIYHQPPTIYCERLMTSKCVWTWNMHGWVKPEEVLRNLWWILVSVLTCKPNFKFGHRGERQIQQTSSWSNFSRISSRDHGLCTRAMAKQ